MFTSLASDANLDQAQAVEVSEVSRQEKAAQQQDTKTSENPLFEQCKAGAFDQVDELRKQALADVQQQLKIPCWS